ncbi:hypothetical protein [Burkholderia pseudomallei]|uniref:hypothetical protein n=1 Tax=Burkholderia pseudomallei TaxID=28450 RepID=UPI0022EB43C1|nr:hypothetical protein [Burkholderia pseudomallei]
MATPPLKEWVVTKISPAAYLRLKEALVEAEILGYGPDAASAIAQTAIGLHPPMPREIVVDYTLDSPIYPFMAWPIDIQT